MRTFECNYTTNVSNETYAFKMQYKFFKFKERARNTLAIDELVSNTSLFGIVRQDDIYRINTLA